MKKISNCKCGSLVANLIPFKASNLHAEFVDGWYVVFSYEWFPILCAKINDDRFYVKVGKRYSSSTQRQQMHVQKEIHAFCDEMPDILFKKFERPFKTI